jgi:hypothetical protein
MRTVAALLLFCALLGAQDAAPAKKETKKVEAPKVQKDDGLLHLAVIVNKKNPVTDLQFSEPRRGSRSTSC